MEVELKTNSINTNPKSQIPTRKIPTRKIPKEAYIGHNTGLRVLWNFFCWNLGFIFTQNASM
jgi:hypothetical protein